MSSVGGDTKHQLSNAYRGLVGFAITAAEAVAVVVVAGFIARRLRARTLRALTRSRLGANTVALIANGVSIAVYVVAGALVLGLYGANWTALLAVFSVGTVAISLALQDVLKNFVAGVYLLLENPFSIGDRIKVKDVTGRVEGIEIRITALRTASDERILVPNATVFSEIITNRSAFRVAQTTVTLKGVTSALDQLRPAVAEAIAGLDGVGDRPPRLTIKTATGDSADVEVRVWHDAESEIDDALIGRLRERFPQTTIVAGTG